MQVGRERELVFELGNRLDESGMVLAFLVGIAVDIIFVCTE